MTEKNNDELEILMNLLLEKNEKKYLLIAGSNQTRDFAIILVKHSSLIYSHKYILEDFQKIYFFKNYISLGVDKCIEIMFNLLKEKQNLIKIEEEENHFLKLGFDIEINVVGLNINLPKEKIEIILEFDNIEENVKNNLIWNSILYLYNEKEECKKKIIDKEKIINQLIEEKNELKQNLEHNKIISYIYEENSVRNDLKKSKIINEYNIKSFDFIKKRLNLYGRDKKLSFQLLYSVKIDGDKSQKFHELCDNHKNTLILIKTDANNIFGGFAGKTWNSLELGRKRDIKSFIFSLDNQKIYNPKIDSKYHLFCSDNDGPCFYAFCIDDECLQNGGFCDEIYKCNYISFESDYELNKGIKNFKIEELEIYEVKLV